MEFNVADLFESLVDVIPNNTAVVSGRTRLTFAQLEERSNRLAHALAAKGVKAGQHVGLYLFNGNEFVESMLACFKLRAVPINVNYRYVDDELVYLFDNAHMVAVIHQQEFSERARKVAEKTPRLHTRIAVADDSNAALAGALPYEEFLASGEAKRDFGPRSGKDHYIIYTGGTTGMPRGVIWQHEDVFYAGLQGGNPGGAPLEKPEELAANAKEKGEMTMTFLPAAPFIHGAAQWTAIIGMFGGGKIVLAPGRSFDAARAVQLIAEEKVNTMTMVGDAMVRPFCEAIRASNGAHDLSSLFVVVSAGAVLSDVVRDDLQSLLPNAMILNSFGASETGHQGTAMPGSTQAGSGRPTFFMDESNTVLDDDLKPLVPGSGQMGRLARTGRLPVGYYNDPEKTAATFLMIDGKRWVVPGDLATVDEDGRITVFGRGAVCINSGGEKIFPEEVEAALKAHPAVLDAVVVGVPDERWGQRVAAVIQPRPGADVTLTTIDAHCRERIAGYKVPRLLRVVSEIQRHPSGKPDYRWAATAALEARA